MMQDIHEGNEFLECGMAGSHVSTLERLFAWEKKLYDEVKVSLIFSLLLYMMQEHIFILVLLEVRMFLTVL